MNRKLMGNPKNVFLRHTLATIAYRFQKSVNSSTEEFGSFNLGHGSRTPSEIVTHIYEVLKATGEFIRDGNPITKERFASAPITVGTLSYF